jgi:hypothetical protein
MKLDWKLIFALSLFGLAMAFGTVFFINPTIEMLLWLPIFIICAFLIAKFAPGRYFLHGFCTSLVNCVWITGAHVIFFSTYIVSHTEELKMFESMPWHDHPRRLMLLVGPLFGIAFGLILGLFSWVAAKLMKKA